MKRRLLLFVWALSCVQALAADLQVYTDSLQSNFADFSFDTVVNLAATAQVHGGTKSISWQPQNYGALSIAQPVNSLSTANYSALSFWLWCSNDCGRLLNLSFQRRTDMQGVLINNVSLANAYPQGGLPATQWTQIVVSLDTGPWALAPAANATFDRFNIQNETGTAPTNTMYIDDIQFIARAVPPPPGPPVLLPPVSPATPAAPLAFTASNVVNGISGSLFAWVDSTGKPRSAHMATGTGGANKGGVLNQFNYRLPNDTTRTVNQSLCCGAGGFGYIVSHLQDASIATIHPGEDDSPLGPPPADNPNGATQTVFSGRHHALHVYTLNYPRWGRIGMVDTKYPMPVTVGWIFATGRNYPLWTVSFDMTQMPANAVSADTRAPYGDMNFDGTNGEGNDGEVAGGVGWGDTYKFRSTSTPFTLNSGWTWNVANTIPHNMLWTQSNDAEMGIVLTQPIAQQDAGGYVGAPERRNSTSAAGSGCPATPTVMPCDFAWPFQSINYSFYNQLGQLQTNSSTQSKRLAWGANFGYLGQTTYPDRSTGAGRIGHPRQSYSTYIVLDTHTRTPTDIQVSQMETRQLSSAAASVGTVATSGPAGLGRPDTITYVPSGFDPIFDAWTFNASGNNATVSFTTPAPYKLHNPLIILRGYSLATEPSLVKVGGVTLTADTDYYASAVPSRNELWLTLRGQYQGTTNLEVTGTGAVVSYTVTPSAGANGTIAPAVAQTVASGATTAFTVTPNAGYTASVGSGCGGTFDRATRVYTTAAIIANCGVSATFALAVNSTTAVASSRNPSKAGQSVTFTAAVTGNAGTPTGNVAFRDGGNAITGCAAVALAAGTAQCTTTVLSPGARAITAQYTGDGFYGGSTSTTLTQTVSPSGITPVIYLLLD